MGGVRVCVCGYRALLKCGFGGCDANLHVVVVPLLPCGSVKNNIMKKRSNFLTFPPRFRQQTRSTKPLSSSEFVAFFRENSRLEQQQIQQRPYRTYVSSVTHAHSVHTWKSYSRPRMETLSHTRAPPRRLYINMFCYLHTAGYLSAENLNDGAVLCVDARQEAVENAVVLHDVVVLRRRHSAGERARGCILF